MCLFTYLLNMYIYYKLSTNTHTDTCIKYMLNNIVLEYRNQYDLKTNDNKICI